MNGGGGRECRREDKCRRDEEEDYLKELECEPRWRGGVRQKQRTVGRVDERKKITET